jgi:hypothetical protein
MNHIIFMGTQGIKTIGYGHARHVSDCSKIHLLSLALKAKLYSKVIYSSSKNELTRSPVLN